MVIDTWALIPIDGDKDALKEWQTWELLPQVEASTVETVGQVTQVLEKPKIDLGQAMNYQIVDISTLTGNESEGQLKALIAKGIRNTAPVVGQDISTYVANIQTQYADELFLQMTQAIDMIMQAVQDKLNEKISANWGSQVVLPEEIAIKMANLKQKVENVGKLNSQELQKVDVEVWVKVGGFFRNLFSKGTKANIKANVQEVFKSNVQRLKDLEELTPEIESLIAEIQQFPSKALEDINLYQSTALLLKQLIAYVDTELRAKIQADSQIDGDTKDILNNDITDWMHRIEYIVQLLEFTTGQYIIDMNSAGALSKSLKQDFITSKHTTIIAANSSQTRDVLKKWVAIGQALNDLENASLESLTSESKVISEAITSLKERQLGTVQKLGKATVELQTLSVKTNERRAKLGQDMGKALLDLSANTKELQQHLLGVKK